MHRLYERIDILVDFAVNRLKLVAKDYDYVRNSVLDILGVAFAPTGAKWRGEGVSELLGRLVNSAVENKIFDAEEAEAYCDKIMGALSLTPGALQNEFISVLKEQGSKAATDMFYKYCIDNNYIKKDKLDKNPRFDGGSVIVTINKAKPEFRDAKKAAAGNSVGGGYPSCSICHSNEGFGGRNKYTLRTIDITLGGEKWFWQYSPYGYFNEHGIAVNYEHTPMHIDCGTFDRLMDFVDIFPHYFLGCNAALPRIGGSVLAHDHYQGGGEVLPLQKAAARLTFKTGDALLEVPDWRGTALRVVGERKAVRELSERIRAAWMEYDNKTTGVVLRDAEGEHNSISPTVRKTARGYEMTIILRNNVTTAQYPDGVFHAHPEFHSVKKESIGLIEAQGLFILPGRLEDEFIKLKELLNRGVESKDLPSELRYHEFIYGELCAAYKQSSNADLDKVVRDELISVCERILENTAVFKTDDALFDFLQRLGVK